MKKEHHTSDRRIHKARVNSFAVLPAQTHGSEFSGDEVFYEYMGGPYEPVQDFKSFLVLEIDGNGSFIPVRCQEVGRFGRKM